MFYGDGFPDNPHKDKRGQIKASTLVAGPAAPLDEAARQTGPGAILAKAFFRDWKMILSLTNFLAQNGLPLLGCEAWSASRKHQFGGEIKSQRVSGLLLRHHKPR
ncbi:MAG: hypothetical protein FWG10_06165 [Eubacteriaceae bacterium]|nr:hypothetical protein [Eubacteriaceae bacterium]